MPKKFDIQTLGLRQKPVQESHPVKVKKPGFGGEVTEWKERTVMLDELQCDLTLKEAKSLEKNCGEQSWTLNPRGNHWLCVATHEDSAKRRFMVTPEVYALLRPEKASE